MKWWQVALLVNLEPGLNGKKARIIVDVQAEDRDGAIEVAKSALMARATVEFAIAEA